ncbi:MAG: hypothetical protein IT159_11740 [Bryobacterales bacterium]|nr:hypothetical protein [Bryobacterales bacterium]
MAAGTRPLWLNPRLVLVLFLVFLSGGLTGALVMRHNLRSRSEQPAVFYTIGGHQVAMEQLARELALNPAQTAQLEMILDDFVMYVQILQMQMDEVRASGQARILALLDENQQAKFHRIMADIQARRP